MDLSPGPTDSDEIIQRYGRRLFVLAYHLTGDGAEADELTIDVLMRAVLAPDQPASEREAGVFLSRLLIAMWKDRLQSGDKGGGPRAVAPGSRGHEALWRALSRLDPVSRAVLVLLESLTMRAPVRRPYCSIGSAASRRPSAGRRARPRRNAPGRRTAGRGC